MNKDTEFIERHYTPPPVVRRHFSARHRGHARHLPQGWSRRGTQGQHTKRFPVLPSRQALKTGVGFVLIAFSLLAAGPLQLWKAENRAKLGALLGFTGPAPIVSPPHSSPFPPVTHVPSPAFPPAPPAAASTRPPAHHAAHFPPAPRAPWGEPIISTPKPEGVLLDYAFKNTPVAVVQVVRFPWDVILTDPHKVHVYRVAEPEDNHTSAAVHVLDVKAHGPYVAVWIPDPGVLGEPEEATKLYRFQLVLAPGAVTRAQDGRSVHGTTHAFLVSEQLVAEDLPFLDMMTPGHIRVSGDKANNPSAPELTRAHFLVGSGLDPDAPPTPLMRIVARLRGSPTIPPGLPGMGVAP
jgi:hypothetical protein